MAQQKKMENQVLSQYFSDCTTRDLLKDPGKDVTTTDFDLKDYDSINFKAEAWRGYVSDIRISEI